MELALLCWPEMTAYGACENHSERRIDVPSPTYAETKSSRVAPNIILEMQYKLLTWLPNKI